MFYRLVLFVLMGVVEAVDRRDVELYLRVVYATLLIVTFGIPFFDLVVFNGWWRVIVDVDLGDDAFVYIR